MEAGKIIRDVHGIEVRPDTPAGDYRVLVDWSDPRTGKALAPEGGPYAAGPIGVPARPAAGS